MTKRELDIWTVCCLAAQREIRQNFSNHQNDFIDSVINGSGRHLNTSREEIETVCNISPRELFLGYILEDAKT